MFKTLLSYVRQSEPELTMEPSPWNVGWMYISILWLGVIYAVALSVLFYLRRFVVQDLIAWAKQIFLFKNERIAAKDDLERIKLIEVNENNDLAPLYVSMSNDKFISNTRIRRSELKRQKNLDCYGKPSESSLSSSSGESNTYSEKKVQLDQNNCILQRSKTNLCVQRSKTNLSFGKFYSPRGEGLVPSLTPHSGSIEDFRKRSGADGVLKCSASNLVGKTANKTLNTDDNNNGNTFASDSVRETENEVLNTDDKNDGKISAAADPKLIGDGHNNRTINKGEVVSKKRLPSDFVGRSYVNRKSGSNVSCNTKKSSPGIPSSPKDFKTARSLSRPPSPLKPVAPYLRKASTTLNMPNNLSPKKAPLGKVVDCSPRKPMQPRSPSSDKVERGATKGNSASKTGFTLSGGPARNIPGEKPRKTPTSVSFSRNASVKGPQSPCFKSSQRGLDSKKAARNPQSPTPSFYPVQQENNSKEDTSLKTVN